MSRRIIICLFILGLSTFIISCSKTLNETTDVSLTGDTGVSAVWIDHNCTSLSKIPLWAIDRAKANLHIAYGHTSHGSQLTTGMDGLVVWKGTQYSFNAGGTGGALDLSEDMGNYGSTYGASDLNQPDYTSWAGATRTYLGSHPSVNVVIWSWCGGVSHASTANIDTYLSLMDQLEKDYPKVKFVYMTGHLDGTGLNGDLHIRNEQIRQYCRDNKKILYDFNDIECYDPDGVYYGDKIPNDNCDYDSDNDGSRDKNWASAWQASHNVDVAWYNCSSAHSQALNANQKAYGAWWLWARLAGWSGK